MFVIVKRAYIFQKDKVEEHPITKEKMQVVEEEFKIIPNEHYTAQYAPDWIKSTDLYKMAQKDKAIVETVEAPAEEEEETTQHKRPASAKGATGLAEHWKK